MTLDIFDPLFELQDGRLTKLVNPLIELEPNIDWDAFRQLLNQALQKKATKSSRSKAP